MSLFIANRCPSCDRQSLFIGSGGWLTCSSLECKHPGIGIAKSVLQSWVAALGLRHQGVLLTAVRGCDTAPKNDPSKMLARAYRGVILNCHCGDPAKAMTFIESPPWNEVHDRMVAYRKNLDHYPHHYVMHLTHASEIVGYKHPDRKVRECWMHFYLMLCKGLHVQPETESQLDERLNADEATFAEADKIL